jgi:hypothetical protein
MKMSPVVVDVFYLVLVAATIDLGHVQVVLDDGTLPPQSIGVPLSFANLVKRRRVCR